MALLDSVKFYFIHFMPYPKPRSPGQWQGQWVDIPNHLFDPAEGQN
ncbi:MAG TPA: hypothetical protein VJS63_05565 [Bradyrhizobium sp.]|nr:hypothetical protein [Bradyrhizobium sp.]